MNPYRPLPASDSDLTPSLVKPIVLYCCATVLAYSAYNHCRWVMSDEYRAQQLQQLGDESSLYFDGCVLRVKPSRE